MPVSHSCICNPSFDRGNYDIVSRIVAVTDSRLSALHGCTLQALYIYMYVARVCVCTTHVQ